MERIPRPGEFYRHFKGNLYQIITVATHSETQESMVVYQALYGDFKVCVRPYEMFVSKTDREKYPDVDQEYRFENVGLPQREEEEVLPKPSLLIEFLDAETYKQKIGILRQMREQITKRELDILHEALDLPVGSGDFDLQLDGLIQFLSTKNRYDGSRLR